MALQAPLFKGDARLEAAAQSDPAHITPGAGGEHVRKIQQALIRLDGAAIAADGIYGSATAAAVLAYKRKRSIINRSYQTMPDNIVGKMTMASLDREMCAEDAPPTDAVCVLDSACPCDRAAPSQSTRQSFAPAAVGAPLADPTDRYQMALIDSRRTLREAIVKLDGLHKTLLRALVPFAPPISADQQKVLDSAVKWLKLQASDRTRTIIHLAAAISLMRRNLAVRTSGGKDPEGKRVAASFHATVDGNPDHGIQLGDPFFGVDGRNCRRDVVTHEFFHFLGVRHGGGPLRGPTIRSAITTPVQALDSADNLAQLVAEVATPSGKTDACARAGE